MIPLATVAAVAEAAVLTGKVAVGGGTIIASAISTLYGVAGDINDFLDRHIEEMKASDNTTVSRTGRVLEMAKFGFGLGYLTPVVVISAGQFLLGNTVAAMGTIASAATLTNPIAMTCASVGAVYYGWGALNDQERAELLERMSTGLEIGVELVKSIIRFVTESLKEILSSKNLEEVKALVGTAAAAFGRTLSDVTRKISDVVSDGFEVVKKKSGEVVGKTTSAASEAIRVVSETAESAAGGVRDRLGKRAKKDE